MWWFALPAVAGGQQVLLIGNSYTARNDLAASLEQALSAQAPAITVRALAEPGYRWVDHQARVEEVGSRWARALDPQSSWVGVVLQEQSQIPALDRASEEWAASEAAARFLADRGRDAGATIVLFQTWGRRDAFEEMQDPLVAGYAAYASTLEAAGHRVEVARVGEAFRWVLEEQGSQAHASLYAGDGSHPSAAGTRLASAVLAATWAGGAVAVDGPDWLDDAVAAVVPPRPVETGAPTTRGCSTGGSEAPWVAWFMLGLAWVRRRCQSPR